jgi:hypothetical protein
MEENLTFNIDKIKKEYFEYLNIQKLIANKKVWLNSHEIKEMMDSNFKVSSSELRKFIENTFGIRMDIDMSHNRNQLNSLIKKITYTKKGKRTFLNLNEYTKLIKLNDFNSFIINNIEKDFKVKDRRKLEKELMYLQISRYKDTEQYKEDNMIELQSFAYYLAILDVLDEKLNYWYSQPFIHNTYVKTKNEHLNNLLDLINTHYENKKLSKYKFHSIEDIETTNPIQKIYFFLRDIQELENKKADHYK